MKGTVKWFDSKKGYGFIAGEDGRDVFVHYSSVLVNGYKTLEAGQTVEFDKEETDRGVKAINVMVQ